MARRRPSAERRLGYWRWYLHFRNNERRRKIPPLPSDFPDAPAGFAFLVDHDGYYLVDTDGAYLLVET